ncbi:tegument protein UL7 [Gallid alphaherpesvirus 1]|uniref:Tegument protein UL7 n=1 Tax=Infectious laryngotracheitis virus TaxID=10386 RepID=F5B4V8_ILTV|nr:tegument protein UL7 [Gallid alphaherpesvirus 1]AEW67802.1 tegument protein UL7 [Gallid alphaherpesvirus 1]AEW67881.1 tegument protein UL7 [Gallid alphaherpesvirus 1]AFD36520.1 UL7 protein [Gallid alphaherpesvirus 1]AFD36599.1 UL7 protein [Gallid alphaherpesvirus 1]
MSDVRAPIGKMNDGMEELKETGEPILEAATENRPTRKLVSWAEEAFNAICRHQKKVGPIRLEDIAEEPEHGPTLEELERLASSGESTSQLIKEISRQAIPRFFFEVRSTPGAPALFASDSITYMDIQMDGEKIILELISGAVVDIEEYFCACVRLDDHAGFIFSVITASEDRVATVHVTWPDFLNRIHRIMPQKFEDFALCLICMYLENIDPIKVTQEHCYKLRSAIARFARTISINDKVRELLVNGGEWLLNTLLLMHDLPPFDPGLVLPHYRVAQPLMQITAPIGEELISSLYSTHALMIMNLPSNENERAIILESRNSTLNRVYGNGNFFTRVLRLWWNDRKLHRSAYKLYDTYF